MILVPAPAHLGHEDGQVVVGAALDGEPQGAVWLPPQADVTQLLEGRRLIASEKKCFT